jgi:hypothetical protein
VTHVIFRSCLKIIIQLPGSGFLVFKPLTSHLFKLRRNTANPPASLQKALYSPEQGLANLHCEDRAA